jgi:hypothetical protein
MYHSLRKYELLDNTRLDTACPSVAAAADKPACSHLAQAAKARRGGNKELSLCTPLERQDLEDFQWLKQEIESAGGEATVFAPAPSKAQPMTRSSRPSKGAR